MYLKGLLGLLIPYDYAKQILSSSVMKHFNSYETFKRQTNCAS